MSVHQSPLHSPHITAIPGFPGIQAVNGVPMMPLAHTMIPTTPKVNAFAANAAEPPPSKGMPSVGSPAPQFKAKAVIDGRIKDIELSQFARNSEWLILVFIPMAWSFICPTEIRAFDRRIQEFETRTCAVVFCSTDSEFVLRAWNHTPEEEGGLGDVHVPLISDRSHRISRHYGVLIEPEGVAQRAMFIIDPRGVVRQVTTNDANVGRSVDEARRLIDALEFTDEFGEGCPIDWKKGDIGINMDSEGASSKRFSSSASTKGSVSQGGGGRTPSVGGRPKHVRQNTWSGNLGWLAGRTSSAAGTPTAETSVQARNESLPVPARNSWASQQNAMQRLAIIDDSQEPPPMKTPTSARQMGSMGGYFDQVVSPLEQPATVLNQMMHSAH